MAKHLLLLLTGAALPAAAQQVPARPSHFPVRHRLVVPPYGPAALALPPGLVPAAAVPAPVPSLRAAAAYAPWSARPSVADSQFVASRHYLPGAVPAPAYDLYENLPEEFRRHTLRAPYTEPLPLQLLRGALGR